MAYSYLKDKEKYRKSCFISPHFLKCQRFESAYCPNSSLLSFQNSFPALQAHHVIPCLLWKLSWSLQRPVALQRPRQLPSFAQIESMPTISKSILPMQCSHTKNDLRPRFPRCPFCNHFQKFTEKL